MCSGNARFADTPSMPRECTRGGSLTPPWTWPGGWIKEQQVRLENGKIAEFRADRKVTFVLYGKGPEDGIERTVP